MEKNYADSLVEITDEDILLKKYYFPTFASKLIKLAKIEKIQIIKKTLFDDEFKVMGTSDFQTWYPLDSLRHKRKFLYLIFEKNKRRKIAFTVEDDDKFKSLLADRGVILQN